MRKILSLRGEALAKVMNRQSVAKGPTRAAYGDKKDCFPLPRKPMVYPAISEGRVKSGIPYGKQPIGARQPQWSYDPDSATAREERVAMLAEGPIGQTWKANASSTRARLDKVKHAKALSQLNNVKSVTDEVRHAVKGK